VETGAYISGLGHVALLGWAILGGVLNSPHAAPEFQVTDISVVSEAAFAALISDTPRTTSDVRQPTFSAENETTPDVPRADSLPVLTTKTTPDTPQDAGISPDLSDVTDTPETTAQIDAPEFGAQPSTDQQGATLIVPTAQIADQDRNGLQQPDRLAILTPEAPAPRVDITPAPKPPTDAEKAADAETATTPDTSATEVADESTEKAPDQAATEIITEAKETDTKLAPTRSSRPKGRPAKLAETAARSAKEIADAVARADAEAVDQARNIPKPTPTGPPLTESEQNGLRLAVRECWNVNPSSEAARITVTIGVKLDRSGKPIGEIRNLSASEGSESAKGIAYEAARRAVLRCAKGGYDLPAEKYDRWRDIEITFNPEKMRRK
jgi:hypothetical protein